MNIQTQAPKMYWQYGPEWCAWWLMIPMGGVASIQGYGPFINAFEIQMAADVHGVPFTGEMEGME